MRILLITDPGIPVPPKGYGGIERVVALLAQEYKRLGHEVDILASSGSYISGCNMYIIGPEGFPSSKKVMNLAIWTAWKFIWRHRYRYDLIHNFGRLLYLLPVLHSKVNKIMSYQREITTRNIRILNKLPNKNLFFTGCSSDLIKRANPPGRWKSVHNPVDFSQYDLTKQLPQNAPLIFLGRIERIKGCHTAIKVAKVTGNRLIIAGNISRLPEELAYFRDEIQPQIDDEQIVFIGEVNDTEKNSWLGKCKALLMPIEWDEPFGIVMVEAMACGTPVIGYNRGSVNEVIDEGITGFKVENIVQMQEAVNNLNQIKREECSTKARNRFDISVIAKKYLSLFYILNRSQVKDFSGK